MRKNFIYLFVAAAALLAISCQKKEADTYQPAEPVSGAQYFFPSSVEKSYKLSADLTSIDIAISRVAKDDASTAKIAVTDTSKTIFAEGKSNITAAFKAGEKDSKITLPIDFSKYEYGDLYGIDIAISEETTPYGASSLHIEINLPEPWVNLGKGTYVDDVACGLYGIDPISVPCTVWANEVKVGLYRIEDFQLPLVAAIFEEDEANLPEGENWRNCPIVIDATDPDDVRIELQDYGIMLNSSDGFIDGITSLYKGEPFSVGTLKDGIISFPEPKGMLCTLNGQGYYYANQHGKFTVALPGAVIADLSTSIEYSGLYTQKDGTITVIAEATLGADVEEALVAIAPGDDPDAAFELIVNADESVLSISASGDVQIPLPEEVAEAYSIVIAPVVDGEIVEAEATYDTFAFKDFSIKVVASEPKINDDEVTATVEASFVFGEDVEYAKVAIFKGKASELTDEDLAIFDDEENDDVKLVKHADDIVPFNLVEQGDYTIVGLSYALEDSWNYGVAEFNFVLVDPWNYLGKGTITDGFFTALFSKDDITVPCDFYENNETPGLYRITGFQCALVAAFFGLTEDEMAQYEDGNWKNTKITVDATDPNAVVIEEQDYGILVNSDYGFFLIETEASGKLENGEITWPAQEMYVGMPGLGKWYYANGNGTFKLVLPTEEPSGAPALAPKKASKGVASMQKSLTAGQEKVKPASRSAVSVSRGRVIGKSISNAIKVKAEL